MDTVKDLVSKLYQSLESVVVNSAVSIGCIDGLPWPLIVT